MNPRKVTPIFKISKFDGSIVKTLMDVYQVAEDSGLSVGGARNVLHDRSLTAGRYFYEYRENWDGVKNFATCRKHVPAFVFTRDKTAFWYESLDQAAKALAMDPSNIRFLIRERNGYSVRRKVWIRMATSTRNVEQLKAAGFLVVESEPKWLS